MRAAGKEAPERPESRPRLSRRSRPSTFWSRCNPGLLDAHLSPGMDPGPRPKVWHPVSGRCFPARTGDPESPAATPGRNQRWIDFLRSTGSLHYGSRTSPSGTLVRDPGRHMIGESESRSGPYLCGRCRLPHAIAISSAVRWRKLRKLERSVAKPMSDSPFGRIFPVLAYVEDNMSSTVRTTMYPAGLSHTARALKCALPHSIFASSLSRRSSVNSPLFVSTTK